MAGCADSNLKAFLGFIAVFSGITMALAQNESTTCHCADGQECDVNTGVCPGGCSSGWSGSCCRTGNIAKNNLAFQVNTYCGNPEYSSEFCFGSADKAVDGRGPTTSQDISCSFTFESINPWWYVAFKDWKQHVIQDVRITSYTGLPLRVPMSLDCHCLNNESCRENGYCRSGCAPGWYGPGCQIGNLAFRKPTSQSSTYISKNRPYTSDLAVDGSVSPSEAVPESCAHTSEIPSEITGDSWWSVTLNEQQVFFIINITLFNRDSNPERLKSFYLLISNSSDDPNLKSWKKCYYKQDAQATGPALYKCNYDETAFPVARRVAVMMHQASPNMLTLCEVLVGGYLYRECPPGLIGPGCMLNHCNSTICKAKNGSCDEMGACRYEQCPDDLNLPPLCFLPKTGFSDGNYSIKVTNTTRGNPNDDEWTTCSNSTTYESNLTFPECSGTIARRLAVVANGRTTLSLCEVVVIGQPLEAQCASATGLRGLQCNCEGDQPCDPSNGFCQSGCKDGWQGVGCQFTNIALYASAKQLVDSCNSSQALNGECVYGAANAVDGQLPSGMGGDNCSSTGLTSRPWWYVQFNGSQSYFLRDIQIIGRQGSAASWLRNFYILVTNRDDGFPTPDRWTQCKYQDSQALQNSTYLCNDIGKKLAIYMNRETSVLSLCEVIVTGYPVPADCPPERIGPGCLLYYCKSPTCINSGGTCSQIQSCLFKTCPNNQHWPPDCWIKVPDLSESEAIFTQMQNLAVLSIEINANQAKPWNLKPTSLILELVEKSSGIKTLYQQGYTVPSWYSANVSINTYAVTNYEMKWIPVVCWSDVCADGSSSRTVEFSTVESSAMKVVPDTKLVVLAASTILFFVELGLSLNKLRL